MLYKDGEVIAINNHEFIAIIEEIKLAFQNKTIVWEGQEKLLTTVLLEIASIANGKINLVLADTLPAATTKNTQYWVKTYEGTTLDNGRFIIITDSLNVATYVGTSEVDLSNYITNEQIVSNLASDYYYCFIRGRDTYYTKAQSGTNVDVYTITIGSGGNVTAITKQGGTGSITGGSLTYNGRSYLPDIDSNGFYMVDSNKKIISVSALKSILYEAGKVDDVKLGNTSIVANKTATIKTMNDLESNFYYAFKKDSSYIYIKTKSIGTNKDTYLLTYTSGTLTKIELSDKKSEIKLDTDGSLIAVYDSNNYSYDKTKDNYYVVDDKLIVPTVAGEIIDKDLSRCFDSLYQTPNLQIIKYGEDVYTATNLSSGIASSVDYDSNVKTQGVRIGKTACVMFHKKLNVTSAITNTWINIGTIKPAFRPKYSIPIVVGIYGMSTQTASVAGNYSAGGHITSDGIVKIWTTLAVGNNMQIRVQTSMYELSDAALATTI